MASFCELKISEAAKGFLSESEVKGLLDELKKRSAKDAELKAEDLAARLDRSAEEILSEKQTLKLKTERERLASIIKKQKIDKFLEPFDDKVEGLKALLDGTQGNIKNNRFSAGARQKAMIDGLLGRFGIMMKQAKVKDLYDDPQSSLDLAKALFDEPVENAGINTLAQIVRDIYKHIIDLTKEEGGFTRELRTRIARQTHNPEKMGHAAATLPDRFRLRVEAFKRFGADFKSTRDFLSDVAYNRWKNTITPLLDVKKTFGNVSAQEMDDALKDIYDAALSGRDIGVEEPTDVERLFQFKRPRSITKRMAEAREIHFKDGESWDTYSRLYGQGSVQEAIFNTIEKAGEQIGLMKTFGPNPKVMFDKVLNEVKAQTPITKGTRMSLNFAESIFKELDGSTRIPVDHMIAKIGQGLRSLGSMAKLGLVLLTSLNDVAIRASLIRSHGVGYLDSYLEAIKPLLRGKTPADQELIVDSLGVWARAQIGHTLSRFSSLDTPAGGMSKLMQKYFSIVGMNWWDRVSREGTATFLSRLMAKRRGVSFKNLAPEEARIMKLYGLDEREWDLIRADGNLVNPYGNELFITPDAAQYYSEDSIRAYLGNPKATAREIKAVRDDIEERLRVYFIDQTDHGLIQPSASDRAYMIHGTQPGTVPGELLRFIGQFKYFNIAMTRRVFGRIIKGEGAEFGRLNAAQAMAEFMVGSTALGYISITSKDALKNRTPRDPEQAKTWIDSMVQGGTFGIWGDYMFGEYNKYGRSLIEGIAGPVAGTIDDVASVVAKIARGDHAAEATLKLLEQNLPFSNVWFTKAAMQHLFLNSLHERVHPGYLASVRRNLRKQGQHAIFP